MKIHTASWTDDGCMKTFRIDGDFLTGSKNRRLTVYVGLKFTLKDFECDVVRVIMRRVAEAGIVVANMDMMITRRFILFDERFVIGVRLKRRNHVVDRDVTRWL